MDGEIDACRARKFKLKMTHDAVLKSMLLQVRGGANDSLSSNTELGQAVQNACEELETLAGLVSPVMSSYMAWVLL